MEIVQERTFGVEEMQPWTAIFIIFCLIFVFCKAIRREIRVNGDDFVSYDMSSIPGLGKNHTIKLDFKTVHPNGVLIYIGSEEELKDFVMLDLVHGKLRVTVNPGDKIPAQKKEAQIKEHVVDDNLIDNEWHKIKLTLEKQQLNITIDGKKHPILLESEDITLNLNGFTYVGGLTKGIINVLREFKPSPNFKGCVRSVYYRKINILAKGIKKKNEGKNGYSEYGSPEYNSCRRARFKTLSFGYPKAFLKLPSKGSIYINVRLHFRTYLADGVLVFKGAALRDRGLPFVSVSLIKGEVVLKVRMFFRDQVIGLSRGKHLNDGEWHNLSVVVNETLMKLKVDELDKLAQFNPKLKQTHALNKNKDLFIGYKQSFVGCIHDLNVDDKKFDLTNIPRAHKSGALRNRCSLANHCFPSPCLHGSKCNEIRSGGFSCDCENTFYYGRLCEKPLYLRTCQEYNNHGLAEDSYCHVDPDAEGPLEPFKVLCNVTEENHTATVVKHNKFGPQRVNVSYNKYIAGVGYFHYVWYSLKKKEISALIAQSEGCRQFVSFKCFVSKLLQAPTGPVQLGSALGSVHWPGEPAGNDECPCKVNGTCADPELPCNCDVGDETWRETVGYVTAKSNLPLSLLHFAPSAAQSNFTVGPLECFGTVTSVTADETRERGAKETRLFHSCRAVNPTKPQPRSSPTSSRTLAIWRTLPEENTSTVGTTVSTATTEISSSQPTSTDASVPPAKTASDHGSFAESKAPPPITMRPFIVLRSTEKVNSNLPTNKTLSLGGTNGNPNMVDQDESTEVPTAVEFSWQLVVTIILLVVVSIMFIAVIGYFVKKQRNREFSCGLFCPKKPNHPLAEVDAGFPEVKMRSRSGEVDLPNARRSIEAGSYNVRTGLIVYGEKF